MGAGGRSVCWLLPYGGQSLWIAWRKNIENFKKKMRRVSTTGKKQKSGNRKAGTENREQKFAYRKSQTEIDRGFFLAAAEN